jgi:Zn-dependent protease with chaperone function
MALLLSALPALAQRTVLEPGFNVYSPEDDIQIGRQVSAEAEKELAIVEDPLLSEYVNRLGLELAAVAPGHEYPYQFRLVNDTAINAFALPGGFIYLNRGIIEAADREAEVAGVLAHEIGHVVLRHGTNQASRNSIFQGVFSILGGIFGGGGGGSVASIVAQAGAGIGAAAFFNRYSRDAERQADLMGAQILYDAGWDPTGMPEFFEKLEAQGGSRGPEFLSSHPNPGNRAQSVAEEIGRLGPVRAQFRDNFSDFRRVRSRLAEVGDTPAGGGRAAAPYTEPPERPSTRYQFYRGERVELVRPNNWQVHQGADSVTLAPERGIQTDGSLAYGFLFSTFDPGANRLSLDEAADRLLDNLRSSNPSMRIEQGFREGRVGGRAALSSVLTSDSSYGGRERDLLVAAFGPDGRTLHYFVGVAREPDFRAYEAAFETILDSIRFR